LADGPGFWSHRTLVDIVFTSEVIRELPGGNDHATAGLHVDYRHTGTAGDRDRYGLQLQLHDGQTGYGRCLLFSQTSDYVGCDRAGRVIGDGAYRLPVLAPLGHPGYLAATTLLVLVLVIGDEALGARRWISLGFVSIQPSELAKLAVVNLLAAYIAVFRSEVRSFIYGIVVPFLPVAVSFALILMEPDLGTGLALLGTAGPHAFGAGARLDYLFLLVLSGIRPPYGW
jgi:hypothetical protein